MADLYSQEINCGIESFWDAGLIIESALTDRQRQLPCHFLGKRRHANAPRTNCATLCVATFMLSLRLLRVRTCG
jgi:hypothetical protein